MRFRVSQDVPTIRSTSIFTDVVIDTDRTPIRAYIPGDSRFSSQWHLLNTNTFGSGDHIDINVVDVWDDYTGAGILVGVVDDGVEYTHPDLAPNYDTSLDHDAVQHDNDAAPSSSDDNHGTAVAGTIGAANNDYNVVGVAFDATIAGLRIGYNSGDGPSQPAENFNYAVTNDFDVLNNSWGYGGFFANSDDFNDPYFYSLRDALENTVENGRGGLGAVVVFASGNSGDQGDDANYHNLLNSRYTVTVGAVSESGNLAYFSTPGAPVLVVAPGESVRTLDREGSAGYSSRDYATVSGTSFAAPIISGVAALMLEANPNLGWRDVQEILALTAIRTDANDASWELNAATNWNGGGMHTSRYYGFGLVDALAAVRFAETWTEQSTSANEVSVSGSSSPFKTIADLGTTSDTINIGSGINIDHVEVTLNLSHSAPVDLIITLISPDGTESQLVVQPGLIPGSDTTPQDGAAGEDGVPDANINFTLSSTEFWGETGEGTWTIRVEDTLSNDSGTLISWSLQLWGDALSDDTTYFFTDEYSDYTGSDVSRRSIDDADGVNTINASAVTTNLVLDLTGTGSSTIDGRSVSLAPGTIIHHAYAGDGDDTIIGNAFDNTLFGGRGNDDVDGGTGTDTIVYLSDADQFTFSMISATEIQIAYTGSAGIDEGTDLVTGVEYFEFGDTTLTKSQVLVLAGGALGPEFTSAATATFAENGTGAAYDADATVDGGLAPTYAITGGADAALFSINTVTGEVTFNAAPDFEAPADNGADNDYVIEITASSDGGDTVQTVTISVTNENDNAPDFTSGKSSNFAEAGSGTAYTATATDVDGETPTFAITGGADASLFSINTVTGEVTFDTPPDYEAPSDSGGDNVYDIDITASDGVNTATQSVSIAVTDVSGPPIITSGNWVSFDENGTGTSYDADAVSPDGPTPTYAITGGEDGALFSINSTTGEVTFLAPPDYESPSDFDADNRYKIQITASSDGQDTVKTVEIAVSNLNDNVPVFLNSPTDFTDENETLALQVLATDADNLGTLTYSITGGPDADLFFIYNNIGTVFFNTPPDYENPSDFNGDNVYEIEVTAWEGSSSSTQAITITVNDIASEYNTIYGSDSDDELTGTDGADAIFGRAGADIIIGGLGIDQLNGGGGDDVFLVAQGDTPDVFNGGTGTDTIAAIESDVAIVFAGGVFGPSNSIELITNDAPSLAGDYTSLIGTSGGDSLDASAQTTAYYIDGLDGNDDLYGGSAGDVIIGGLGRDNMTGNGGADIFVVSDGTTRDTIQDFDVNAGDVINFAGVTGFNSFADVQAAMVDNLSGDAVIRLPDGSRVIVSGVSSASLTANDFSFSAPPTPAGFAASASAIVSNTTIEGTSSADTYDFSATTLEGIVAINMGVGNDVVVGSAGGDIINGEGDDDRISGLGGDDTVDGGTGTDTLVLQGARGAYVATQIDGDSVQLVSAEGTDTIHNVELFEFDDGTLTFAELLGINYVPVFTSGATASVDENATGVAYDADATDADSAAPTYAITGGADAALFSINSVTGEVSFDSAPDFEAPADANGDNDYVIEITASSGGDDTVQTVTITVDNLNDNNPIFTSGTSTNFAENGTGTAYTATATDGDGTSPSFAITGGADASLFAINTITGQVTFIAPPDYETPGDSGGDNVYDIDITASDGLNTATQSVSITVTDVDGTPVFASGTSTSFAENGTGTVYDANATSGDGPAPVYSITGGADAALFSINTVTGEVTFDTPPDYETPGDNGGNNVYDIIITADSDGLTTSQSVSITVTDEPEGGVSYTVLTGTSGSDTFDASGETTPYYIDGLDGNDQIIGGSADDVLIGGAGRDNMTGNGGADTFVISDGTTRQTITDFDVNSGDVVNFSGVTGFNSFGDVLASATENTSGDVVIRLPDGARVVMSGVGLGDLSSDDFSFIAPPSPAVASAGPNALAMDIGGNDGFIWSGQDGGLGFDALLAGTGSTDLGTAPLDFGAADADSFILGGLNAPLEGLGKFGATIVAGTLERDILGDADFLDFGPPSLVQPIEDFAPMAIDTAPWEEHSLTDLFTDLNMAHSDHFIL